MQLLNLSLSWINVSFYNFWGGFQRWQVVLDAADLYKVVLTSTLFKWMGANLMPYLTKCNTSPPESIGGPSAQCSNEYHVNLIGPLDHN